MADPTLYLFDGYNLLHAGAFASRDELTDRLASFVALRGARGIVVFDGVGTGRQHGPLEVRFAAHADALLERLAADHRGRELVCLVSSDGVLRATSGLEVVATSSRLFAGELRRPPAAEPERSPVAERLDEETREQLERLRRARD